MKKYIITIIILFTFIILAIGGYFIYSNAMSNQSSSTDKLKEKCLTELQFLSTETIEIMNELNNISYANFEINNKEISSGSQSEEDEENTTSDENSSSGGSSGGNNGQSNEEDSTENTIDTSLIEYNNTLNVDNNDVDWSKLKMTIENIYSSWTSILIDLTTLEVNNENLLKFNTLLDKIIADFENEDKQSALSNTAELYNLLYLYIKDFANDPQIVSIFNIKSNILYAYSLVEKEDWNQMKNYIGNAKQEFNNVLNNQVNNIDNIDVINKAYILINELDEDISNKSKKTFYINYKNLMQELEAI